MGLSLTDILLLGNATSEHTHTKGFYILGKRKLLWGAIGHIIDVVVSGVSPLSLPDAIANSLSYVKAFGGTEQRNLPDDYTALEYIESSGTQYIGLDVSGDATFIGTAQSTTDSPTTSQVLVANSGASAGHWFGVQSPSAGSSFAKRWGLGATATASTTIDGTTKVDFEITFTQSSQYGTVNDQVLNRESSTSAHTNWVIFAGNTNPSYGFIGKVWGLKVVQNDVLVRNLIPAKNSSNIVGMYDIVNDVFYENAGSGTFTAGPTAVPNPDAPMDIVSNNGVLKARHESGLPLGYTLLEYIESDGTQYIDTGVVPANKKISAIVDFQFTDTPNTFGGIIGSNANDGTDNIQFSVYQGKWRYKINSFAEYGDAYDTNRHTIYLNTAQGTKLDNIVITSNQYTIDSSNNYSMFLFGVSYSGQIQPTGASQVYTLIGRIYSAKIYNNGSLVLDLVPVKHVSGNTTTYGMYDIINDVFYTNAGTGTFTAGSTVSDPVEIYTDGTVETINVHGKNLFDSTPYKTGYYIDASGNEVAATQYQEEYLIRQARVQPSTQYTISFTGVIGGYTQRIHAYDANGNWLSQVAAISTITPGVVSSASFTTPANCAYIRQGGRSQTEYQLERGSTATDYVPYFDGGTATAEMLLKIDSTYIDQQEIIDGTVTRKVGVKVLDGTENWTMISTAYADGTYRIYTNDFGYAEAINGGISTHFVEAPLADRNLPTGQQGKMYHSASSLHLRATQFASLEVAKQWLADQYAAGTPVIVIYPLGTATTESVAGQTLQVQDGDNTLEITQASLNGLELEATYKKQQ